MDKMTFEDKITGKCCYNHSLYMFVIAARLLSKKIATIHCAPTERRGIIARKITKVFLLYIFNRALVSLIREETRLHVR